MAKVEVLCLFGAGYTESFFLPGLLAAVKVLVQTYNLLA